MRFIVRLELLSLVLNLVLISSAWAKLPAALKSVEALYGKTQTVYARFEQVTTSGATKTKKTESGFVIFQKPNRMRWEFEKPDPKTLVSDGKKFWFYTPPFFDGERGQVIIQNAKEIRSRLAEQLMSGNFSNLKDAEVEEHSLGTFQIKPKSGSAGSVKTAILKIDPKLSRIEEVYLEHTDGNRTEIKFSNIELGKKFSPETFRFQIPKNTDLIKN
jgi:outer membrane lipoprotein carrier protein